MNRFQAAYGLLRFQGVGWCAYRFSHALKTKSGWYRAVMPKGKWADYPLDKLLRDSSDAHPTSYFEFRRLSAPKFFFRSEHRAKYEPVLRDIDSDDHDWIERIERLKQGEFTLFGHKPVRVGFPPVWHRNPLTGQNVPSGLHWSQIGDFSGDDIKGIWELSRFGFVYDLARAYWRSADESLPEAFWRLIESWRDSNPPNCGSNWKCGQEISIRLMAWCFGLYAFFDSIHTTAERVAIMGQMIAASAGRIERHFDYALRQNNNHPISEACGLWTVGLLFPEFSRSSVWRELGRMHLEKLAGELIYEDGSFAQHSANYHRLVLHLYVWAMRLGDLNDTPLNDGTKDRVHSAFRFLEQLQDSISGRVPNFGPNDGALILPLSECALSDFRPVVQAVGYYFTGNRHVDPGAWDEELLWLFGPASIHAKVTATPRTDYNGRIGGGQIVRGPESFAFVRCPEYRHRPAQADALHVDLWWKGKNVAGDPGTFSYAAAAPWQELLGETRLHNTVTVDGRDQMLRAGRFIWIPWTKCTVRADLISPNGHLSYWEGEQDGYRGLKFPVRHGRAVVRAGDDNWLVLDSLRADGPHNYRLHWLLPEENWIPSPAMDRLQIESPEGSLFLQTGSIHTSVERTLVRGGPGMRGWMSRSYLQREPVWSLECVGRASAMLFWTWFGPVSVGVTTAGNELRLAWANGSVRVRMSGKGDSVIAEEVRLEGVVEEVLYPGEAVLESSANSSSFCQSK